MDLIHVRFSEAKNKMEELRIINSFERYNNVLSQSPELEKNDFELQVKTEDWKRFPILMDDWIYIAKSEWGGMVESIEHVGDIVKLSGANFRGRLSRHSVSPTPLENEKNEWNGKFSNYISVKEYDANQYLNLLYYLHYSKWGQHTDTDPHVLIYSKDIGVVVTDEIRFANFLERVTEILRTNKLRIETSHEYFTYYAPKAVYSVQAKKITDYSDAVYFDKDSNIEITSKISKMKKKTYCLCLWRGEMEERETVLLSIGLDGRVGETEPFWQSPSFLSNTIIYDNPNAETKEELVELAKKMIQESHSTVEQIEFTIKGNSHEYFVGDFVGGKDEITGVEGKKEIIEKELTIEKDGERISYKVE